MKINRLKKAQLVLTFYKNNFGFYPPFKIIIDGTILNLCLKLDLTLENHLSKYLNDNLTFFTTKCVIKEMEKLGEPVKEALKIIKSFKIQKCIHSEPNLNASKCLLKIFEHENNNNHFFLATQDKFLISNLFKKTACPLITIKLNSFVLLKPSQASKDEVKKKLKELVTSDYEMEKLKMIKKVELNEESNELKKSKRKRKGPNPLSCLKKKAKEHIVSNPTSTKRKRKNKNKVSKHIRKLLKNNNQEI